MADPVRRLAAVVLNYRTPERTLAALAALRASSRPLETLVVVDNGALPEASVALRQGLAPSDRLVVSEKNLGFAGGCNLGIREALGPSGRDVDGVLLVNSDLLVDKEMVGRLEGALWAWPEAGIAGPLVLKKGETGRGAERIESAGLRYCASSGRMRLLRHGEPYREELAHRVGSVHPVEGVAGCAMLVKREVFSEIGLFDEDYFFSYEDLDLCLRARDAGFLSLCVESATALHEGSASIGARSERRHYFGARNQLRLAERFGDPARLQRWRRGASVLTWNLAQVLWRAEAPRVKAVQSVLRGASHHWLRRYGPGGTE